ncbi:separase isoform X2 [Punica granatum]|uniref:separase n=1 Tax=Punica granatum TaxID=22663 RepID=A0A6P8D8G8_PUNGR|nr:separase isoform X2 [Punica granatum]
MIKLLRMCSLLLSEPDERSSFILDIINRLSECGSPDGKVGRENDEIELIELVSYCASRCRNISYEFICTFAANIEAMACKKVQMPIDMILQLYAVGLYLSDAKVKPSGSTSSGGQEDGATLRFLYVNAHRLNVLSSLLGPLQSYFQIECKEIAHGQNDSCKDAESDTRKKKETYLPLYMNALKFLCQPLAELVNVERKQLLAGNEMGSAVTLLCAVQGALNQFCDVLLFHCSSMYERERDGFEDHSKMLLGVAVAAFTLSLITKLNLQSIMNLIEQTISSQWVQQQGLKFLLSSLYNIGVVLYRNKRVKEASKALKLSCQASWTCIMLFCQRSEHDSHGIGNFSDDAIVDFINEACARSAFYLDILHQRGSKKLEKTILSTIWSWSVAQSKFSRLPGPMALVKQWAKIQCKEQKNSNAKNGLSTLCELLLHSSEVSGGMLAIISEQELLAYKEMSSWCPDLCKRMNMRITDVLLEKADLQDNVLQKARLLIERGKTLGVHGIVSLNECIELLSRAASEKTAAGSFSHVVLERHQLATAYCLRALCIQEVDPKSKGILQDITVSLNLWSGIFTSDDCSADELSRVLTEVSLTLFSCTLDLLALKGCFAFHLEIEVWKIIMKVFRCKNIPLENCVSYFWECRRMSHALCTSPISNAFIKIMSEHFGEHSASVDYWISCLKGSQPLIVGLQNSFSFICSASSQGSSNPEISLQLDTAVGEVKEAVLELVSSVPVHSRSTFTAGHLLYDLSERLISSGCLHEALLSAKESHRLRTKLFQEKFTYSIEQRAEKYGEVAELTQKNKYSVRDLQVSRSVVGEVWTFELSTFNLEDTHISPWNVLQGYLESTLQVGTIYELIGNVTEAETFFLWGKDISWSQDLTHFTVTFSSALGKLYCKKRLWNLADRELQSAKQIVMDWNKERSMSSTCSRCCWLLEAGIELQLGNLIRSEVDRTTRLICMNKLSKAEKLFRSALDKLNHFEWKSSDVHEEEKEESSNLKKMNYVDGVYQGTNTVVNQLAARKILPASKQDVKIEIAKGRKAKTVAKSSLKEHCIISDANKRVTRSRYRSSKQNAVLSGDAEACPVTSSSANQTDSLPQQDNSGNGVSCICNNMKCWRCLLTNVAKSGLLNNYINMRWELFRRRISTGLLIGIGKCIGNLDEVHTTHKIFLQSISNLAGGSNNELSHVSVDLIGKEFSGEMLAIERAVVLYSMSWFLLKSYRRQSERNKCCHLAQIQLQQVVSWLKLAFVLCHEVPALAQKVARLLAVTYIISASSEPFSSSRNALSENYWASYFHQASIGSHLNHQFSLHIIQKEKVQDNVGLQGSTVTDSTSIKAEMFSLPRLAPESVKDLEDWVRRFFKSLPCTTIICISVLGDADSSLLQELFSSSARAWLLLSRLNSEDQPIILLKPLDPILEDAVDDGTLGSGKLSDVTCSGKHWHCPWGSTVIDDVIPTYKEILEENYLSSSNYPLEDTKENRLSWWKRRKNLDLRLNKLLRKLEDLWLGPWKYLLLGGLINSSHLDSLHRKLMRDLKSKCKVDASEALVRVILGGAKSASEAETFIPELHSKRSCHICCITQHDEARPDRTSTSDRADKLSSLASQLVQQAISELEVEDDAHREPTILVLDCEVQMLPWENFPILRSQEVYRMPSVGSISVTIDRSRNRREHVGKVAAAFPFIDPLDAFFLLNPGGDLRSTQIEFENWFRDHKLEGKVGSPPATEELARALQQHDLFIYFGHGSGAQYIPRHEVQKLETCAATFLMGCSSGALSLHGSYAPEGMPLAYLAAGSPVIVANLWEVTDKDIDRFGKAMLDAWLEERSNATRICTQCDSLTKEFEAMDLRNNCTGKNSKKLPKKQQAPESQDCIHCCNHSRARIGSFMGQARKACMLPFLIGAAPVCYGVPTGIKRKKDL